MLQYLQKLSGFFFYLLGSSFFVAWVLLHNLIRVQESAWWLQTEDLPLAFSALTYGGLSLYLSLTQGHSSKKIAWGIAVPLAIFFALMLVMNFWPH